MRTDANEYFTCVGCNIKCKLWESYERYACRYMYDSQDQSNYRIVYESCQPCYDLWIDHKSLFMTWRETWRGGCTWPDYIKMAHNK